MSVRLEARDLVIDIPGRPPGTALALAVEAGQCWGVLGPNGAGKTTLLMTLAGLRPPRTGGLLLDEHPLTALPRRQIARRLGVLFQQHGDAYGATVLETALMGRHAWLSPWEPEGPSDHALAEAALARMDLAALRDRAVQTLSGGERQRLAFASLLTQDPQLLLLDEPTNHLDLHHQIALLEIVRSESRRGRGVVMALHDVNLAARFCSHILLLYGSGEACWGPAEVMLTLPALERLYGQPLARGEVEGLPVFLPRDSAAPTAG